LSPAGLRGSSGGYQLTRPRRRTSTWRRSSTPRPLTQRHSLAELPQFPGGSVGAQVWQEVQRPEQRIWKGPRGPSGPALAGPATCHRIKFKRAVGKAASFLRTQKRKLLFYGRRDSLPLGRRILKRKASMNILLRPLAPAGESTFVGLGRCEAARPAGHDHRQRLFRALASQGGRPQSSPRMAPPRHYRQRSKTTTSGTPAAPTISRRAPYAADTFGRCCCVCVYERSAGEFESRADRWSTGAHGHRSTDGPRQTWASARDHLLQTSVSRSHRANIEEYRYLLPRWARAFYRPDLFRAEDR